MKLDELRSARLPDETRARIIAEIRSCRNSSKSRNHRLRLIAVISVAMLAVTAFTVGAAIDRFGLRIRNKSHIPEESCVETQTIAHESVENPLTLTCNGAAVGGDRVYFELTLSRSDGLSVFSLPDGASLTRVYFTNASLSFSDGKSVKIYPILLTGSDELEYRIEASFLLTGELKSRLGEDAVLTLDSALLEFENSSGVSSYAETAVGVEGIEVKLPWGSSTLECAVEPFRLYFDGTEPCFDRIRLDGGSLTIYGEIDCADFSELPSLSKIMNEAVLISSDGTEIVCGNKNGAGTNSDGEFELNWLLATVVNPSEITAIRIGENTVKLENSAD